MRHDHLGLIPAVRHAGTWTGVVVATVIAAATPVVVGSSSAFHDSPPPRSASLVAARFAPATASVVTATVVSGGVTLSWLASTVGDAVVSYRVERTDDLGAVSAVCVDSSAPVATSGTMRCTDTSAHAGRTYRYTQQPVLVRGGAETWSQAPSAPSQPITLPPVVTGPRFSFATSSASVTSIKSGPIELPYPAGTSDGDLLVLVSFGGRSSVPGLPAGWSEIASLSQRGPNSSNLYVAWRSADSTGAVTFDAVSNSAGTVTRLFRYARAPGVTEPPVLAGLVSSGMSAAAASLSSIGATTTASSATVVEIAALLDSSAIRLASDSHIARLTETSTPGRVTLAVGVADTYVADAGMSRGATWQQDGSTAEWLWTSVAFR